jgi:N-acetylmuramic acid 6-phosphate etherase
VDRGVKMVMSSLSLSDYEEAKNLLLKYGSVKKAVEAGSM